MSVSTPILTTLLDKKGSIWAEAVAVSAKAPAKPRITASLIGNSFRVALTPRDSRATFRSFEQYPHLLISLRRVGPTLPIPAFRRSWRALAALESLGSMHVGNVSHPRDQSIIAVLAKVEVAVAHELDLSDQASRRGRNGVLDIIFNQLKPIDWLLRKRDPLRGERSRPAGDR